MSQGLRDRRPTKEGVNPDAREGVTRFHGNPTTKYTNKRTACQVRKDQSGSAQSPVRLRSSNSGVRNDRPHQLVRRGRDPTLTDAPWGREESLSPIPLLRGGHMWVMRFGDSFGPSVSARISGVCEERRSRA